MHDKLQEFYNSKQEPNKSCLLALRDIVLAFHREIQETIKYGMPCFVYNKKQFCYLWTDKKTNNPYLLIVEGKNIDHPSLEQGHRKRMKILPIDPLMDIPISTIREIFTKALEFYLN